MARQGSDILTGCDSLDHLNARARAELRGALACKMDKQKLADLRVAGAESDETVEILFDAASEIRIVLEAKISALEESFALREPYMIAPPSTRISPSSSLILEYAYDDKRTASNNETPLDPVQEFNSRIELGQGGFGMVHQAKLKTNWTLCDGSLCSKKVAIKVARVMNSTNAQKLEMALSSRREVEALRFLGSHANICTFYGWFQESPEANNILGIVLEFCEFDLSNWKKVIHEYKPRKNAKDGSSKRQVDLIKILAEVADALCYMHEKGFAHRDIKLKNILIKEETELDKKKRGGICGVDSAIFMRSGRYPSTFSARICDFGTSKVQNDKADENTNRVGTAHFKPPESHSGKYGPFTDCFSLGVTIRELLDFTWPRNHYYFSDDKTIELRPSLEILHSKFMDRKEKIGDRVLVEQRAPLIIVRNALLSPNFCSLMKIFKDKDPYTTDALVKDRVNEEDRGSQLVCEFIKVVENDFKIFAASSFEKVKKEGEEKKKKLATSKKSMTVVAVVKKDKQEGKEAKKNQKMTAVSKDLKIPDESKEKKKNPTTNVSPGKKMRLAKANKKRDDDNAADAAEEGKIVYISQNAFCRDQIQGRIGCCYHTNVRCGKLSRDTSKGVEAFDGSIILSDAVEFGHSLVYANIVRRVTTLLPRRKREARPKQRRRILQRLLQLRLLQMIVSSSSSSSLC
jgi:serine/threonine protein kinase